MPPIGRLLFTRRLKAPRCARGSTGRSPLGPVAYQFRHDFLPIVATAVRRSEESATVKRSLMRHRKCRCVRTDRCRDCHLAGDR